MGPLPELVAEMAEAAPKHRYHQVMLDSLLWLTNKHLETNVSEGTIKTVRDLKEIAYIGDAGELTAKQSELIKEILNNATSSDLSKELRLIRERLVANVMEGFKIGPDRDGGRDVEITIGRD